MISDMESQMYTSPENVKEYLENNPKKPFLLCEYMHDMGNSWEEWNLIFGYWINMIIIRGIHLGLYGSGTLGER